ncbi:MAG: hypothetical protein M0Z85_04415 [Gammaproteobacteria bacterium]|jgi:hypothetical protein|nr:hypothetical protein [Gammaproteobacteria bacterium]
MVTAIQQFRFHMEREWALRKFNHGNLAATQFQHLFWQLVRAAQDTDINKKTHAALDRDLVRIGGTAAVRYLATCGDAADVGNTASFIAYTFGSEPDKPEPIQTRLLSNNHSRELEPINAVLDVCRRLERTAKKRYWPGIF